MIELLFTANLRGPIQNLLPFINRGLRPLIGLPNGGLHLSVMFLSMEASGCYNTVLLGQMPQSSDATCHRQVFVAGLFHIVTGSILHASNYLFLLGLNCFQITRIYSVLQAKWPMQLLVVLCATLIDAPIYFYFVLRP